LVIAAALALIKATVTDRRQAGKGRKRYSGRHQMRQLVQCAGRRLWLHIDLLADETTGKLIPRGKLSQSVLERAKAHLDNGDLRAAAVSPNHTPLNGMWL
jgi:hypothetical protein